MQLADYAMIANSVPQNVQLKDPQEIQAQKLTIDKLALGNKREMLDNQKAEMVNAQSQRALDDNKALSDSVRRNTQLDQFGNAITDHKAVVADLMNMGKGDIAHDYQLGQSEKDLKRHAAANKYVIDALGAAISEQDPEKKNAIWKAGYQKLSSEGYDLKGVPQQYDDATAKQMYGEAIGVSKLVDQHLQELRYSKAANQKGENGYHVPLSTSSGVYDFDARTGGVRKIVDENNNTLIKDSSDPVLQGKLSNAKTEGKNIADRKNKASTSESLLDQQFNNIAAARELLPKATGSWVGVGRDAVAGAAGIATEGKKAAAQLETIGSWMQLNVPRFEGPQSDRDTQVYQKMAARVADSTEPVESRLAALNVLEQLTKQFSQQNKKIISGSDQNKASSGNAQQEQDIHAQAEAILNGAK